ncbi:hypothetical protein [Streptomyces xanthochromogenes]
MALTINAHQMQLLLDKTINHMGKEGFVHGVRLDADARFLYAVASDRYTLAVARYAHGMDEQASEPWAHTIPGAYVPALRDWLASIGGATDLKVETSDNQMTFVAPQTSYRVTAAADVMTFDWRGILRSTATQETEEAPFPALSSDLLARWAGAGQILHTRVSANRKAVLFFGEDFIGAQMPRVWSAPAASSAETFSTAYDEWLWTLAAGAKGVDFDSLPKPKPSPSAKQDLRDTAAGLLRGVLASTSDAFPLSFDEEDEPEAWLAHIRAGVADWMAYRYLEALQRIDPRAAQAVVDETAEELDCGELGEWAWDLAEKAGHDPEKWQEQHAAHRAKKAAERPAPWARALARGLNGAHQAGINTDVRSNPCATYDIETNPHITFDIETNSWKALVPQEVLKEAEA